MSNIQSALDDLINNVNNNMASPLDMDDFEQALEGDNVKSRVWVMLLYPDNEEHKKVIDRLSNMQDFLCIGALHDKDRNAEGELKKAHYHFVLYFPGAPVYRSHITKVYPEIETRFIRPRKEVKVQVRYLMHLDSPSKYQYQNDCLVGDIERFYKYIDVETLESANVLSLLDLIESNKLLITAKDFTLIDFLRLICQNGFYSYYRRNAYTFNSIFYSMQNKNDDKKEGSL